MKAVVQRVSSASVRIEGVERGSCGKGLVVLAAVHKDDHETNAAKLADRIWGLRIFNDTEGKMNLALKELAETESVSVLAISNFTIYGETSKNRRPSFIDSAPFEPGKLLFDEFVKALRSLGCEVSTGVFGADMQLELVNDGPVTVIVEA